MSASAFEYLTMRCVVQHLAPHIRFNLSLRCEAVKAVDKKVPMKISSMRLGSLEFKADFALYKISIVRHYFGSETPEHIIKQNSDGGVSFEVDHLGFRLAPEQIFPKWNEILYDGRANHRNQTVGMEADARTVDTWEQELKKLERDRNMQVKMPRTSERKEAIAGLERKIKNAKDKLLPYHLKRNGGEPPYTHFIRLTINERLGNEIITRYEHMDYSKPAHAAMLYLKDKLLKGRRSLHVNYLKIYSAGLIRISNQMKIKLHKISISSEPSNVLNAIERILDRDSFPLEAVEVFESGPFENDKIQSASLLTITGNAIDLNLTEITNTRVHVARHMLPIENVIELVDNWMVRGRDVGFHYSFTVGINRFEQADQLLEMLKEAGHFLISMPDELRETRFNEMLLYRMTETTELRVFCVMDPDNRNIFNFNLQVEADQYLEIEENN
ncbi:hypothetical protein CRE_16998 [Caenorhabditis remanei]|uniref:Uncharacterized protein n=1 Tax=Caenorhabditis remanei TaxID=31234 RepID=E3N7W2_CAERE|nr:hypothetical protein CRE_16998 [Caenorhabditis remanei]